LYAGNTSVRLDNRGTIFAVTVERKKGARRANGWKNA
jgi:hypothetical protein